MTDLLTIRRLCECGRFVDILTTEGDVRAGTIGPVVCRTCREKQPPKPSKHRRTPLPVARAIPDEVVRRERKVWVR